MQKAVEMAKIALSNHEVPIGAIVVKNDQIISRGYNQKESLNDPTAHAEIIAIRSAAETLGTWRLNDCSLFVTAEPCPMCMGAVIQAHIPKLVYGATEKRYGSVETTAHLKMHPMLPKDFEIYGGICEKECADLLQSFFQKV